MPGTISERLVQCSNRPAGFDYMRLILASLVVLTHSMQAMSQAGTYDTLLTGPLRPFLAMILGMFFGLSGFLVAGSLERCRTMVSFVGLRLIRLVPALALDTVLAALILGPLFTTLPLSDYFSSPVFRSYFLNIVGEVHFFLPGVFDTHPWTSVNGQLWTLPYELKCYALLTALAVIGIVRYRSLFAVVTGLIVGFCLYLDQTTATAARGTLLGRDLILCFLLGVTSYLYRDKIILSRWIFVSSLLVATVLLYNSRLDALAVIPISYAMLFLGLMNPSRLRIVSSGDYSYGIFLYGFAVQQAVFTFTGPNPWLNFLLAYPVVLGLAVASWFLVEKPALRLRPKLVALEAWLIRRFNAVPLGHLMMQPPVGPWLRRSPARERS